MWQLRRRKSVVGAFLIELNSEAEVLVCMTVSEPNECKLSRESSAIYLFPSILLNQMNVE